MCVCVYSGPQGGFTARPFFVQFLVHHTLVRQRGPKKWPKGTQNGAQKRRQRPKLFWVANRIPKREPKGIPRAHKGPKMAPRGAKMMLKGSQICPTNSFKARRVFETAPRHILWSRKGPKMNPKWIPKPYTFSNLFVHQFGARFGTCWGPKMNPIRDTRTWRNRK